MVFASREEASLHLSLSGFIPSLPISRYYTWMYSNVLDRALHKPSVHLVASGDGCGIVRWYDSRSSLVGKILYSRPTGISNLFRRRLMKPKERDDLLIETANDVKWLVDITGKQEKHLANLNGHLDDHSKRLVIVETKVEERTANKITKKAIAGYGGGGLLVLAITILQVMQMLSG